MYSQQQRYVRISIFTFLSVQLIPHLLRPNDVMKILFLPRIITQCSSEAIRTRGVVRDESCS